MAISGMDFSGDAGKFGFGVSRDNAVAALRGLADGLASGEVLLQGVRVTSLASHDEFTVTGIRLVLAERHDWAERMKDRAEVAAARGIPPEIAMEH